ncbi:MAG: beta-galactosidase [Ignavibacteriae bacterium]|nr:beta-galactosidase [Ignavibacteriota bacterium]
MKVKSFILLAFIFWCSSFGLAQSAKHSFALGDNDFLLDGKPFQMIAGEMHYARIPKEYWRHRLKMARAMGLNTITTYVFWNYHEPKPGEFDFTTENRNITEFIRIAQEEGLWVVVRPGPYACAEWEFGGYPAWLLKDKDVLVRSKDARFLQASERYLKRFGEEIGSLQITKGGPVLMVQVENEYGSYGDDKEFMGKMRDYIRSAGFDVPLFTADGPSQCKNGYVNEVLPGINGDYNPQSVKDTVRKYNGGKGPFFVPEFYPGWLDHWGEEKSIVPVESFIGKFDTLLLNGISVSLYMFHGGTNFGFMNGANYGGKFQPQPTSYDYDAPLDEAGRPTPKYFKLREIIAKHLPEGTKLPDVPPPNSIIEIPRTELSKSASLFESLPNAISSKKILTMEDVGQSYGYILYRTQIKQHGEGKLVIKDLRDYAAVFLDRTKIASLDRRHKQSKIDINIEGYSATLDILIENGGRINYGNKLTDNRNGITEQVTFNGNELTDWEIFSLPFDDVSNVRFEFQQASSAPVLYRSTIVLPKVGDTFLDMRGWNKGCVWVNEHNLGRFWYIGPQQTLYVPGVWLKEGDNEITVLDLEQSDFHSIQGLKEPVLNELKQDELAPSFSVRVPGMLKLDETNIVSYGEFVPGDSLQTKNFKPTHARYICLQSLSSLRNDPFASIAELFVLDEKGKPLPREGWKIFAVESEELKAEDGRAENAFDDDIETIWHTQWGSAKPPHPHAIAIDLGNEYVISGFQYQSRSGNAPGKIKEFKFYARKQSFEIIK